MNLKEHLRYIPGFPEEGVTFIDITTVLKDPIRFHAAISELAKAVEDLEFDVIVGAESRGFIMGAPLAYALGKGFIPVRKKMCIRDRCRSECRIRRLPRRLQSRSR